MKKPTTHTRIESRRFRATDEDVVDGEPDLEKMVKQVDNRVYFHAVVSRPSVLLMIDKLHAAENAALTLFPRPTDAYVMLFIHSEGGDAYAGLSGMNHIENSRVPIVTISDGFVASAATFLLLGGVRRYAMPQSCILIHQVSSTFWGKYAELQDEMHNSTQLMTTLVNLYRRKTHLKRQRVKKMLTKELTLTATKCVKRGIVHALFRSAEFAPKFS